jgi:tetratricopeptide (TPR) repeat protein
MLNAWVFMKRIIKTFLILFILSAVTNHAAGNSPADRYTGLNTVLKDKPGDTALVNSFVRKGFNLMGKKGMDLRMVAAYIDTACLICEKNEFDYPPPLHLLKAEYFYEAGDFTKSETEATLAVSKSQEEKNYKLQATSLLFLGKYYQRTGFYQQSIDSYSKSIALAKEKGINGIMQKAYGGQAGVYYTVNDLNEYIKNLRNVIESSMTEKDTLSAEEALLKLGTLFTEDFRDFRLASSTLRECINLSEIRKDSYFTAFANANMGWNFYREKMYDSAIYYYQKSLKYSLPVKQYGTSANALGNLGTINRDLGNYETALKYYNKSLDHARMINDWYTLSWVNKDMSDLFLSLRDTSRAFKTFVVYKQFNDSVQARKNTTGLAEARIRYDADAHNKEIALLSLRLKNNRILTISYTVLVITLVVIGFLIMRGYKISEKRRISEMNHRISEVTQANLRQQMNPHFIFNTLNSIQYYMYQHDKLATNNYLTKFSSLMRKVLDNSQHTSVPLRDELDALNLYLELECLRFKDKFEFKISVDEDIDPLMYKVPTMLIQPYVENSICHGLIPMEGKGFVNIDLKLYQEHLVCTIEDNGIGRDAASERKKMRETNHNSLGTRITASRLELVNALYGTSLKTVYIDLKNEKGEAVGTRVEIHIPILT